MRSDALAKCVPGWAGAEYVEYLAHVNSRGWEPPEYGFVSNEQRLAFYKQIMQSDGLAEFWSAIEKRRGVMDDLRVASAVETEIQVNQVGLHLETLLGYWCGTSALEMLGIAERKRRAKKIIDLIERLTGELNELRNLSNKGEPSIPLELRSLLGNETSEPLSRMKAEADIWANSTPIVLRSRNGQGRRTYFIRGLTRFYMTFYGKPLRNAVAALVRAIYDTEISAAEIEKIAPVSSRNLHASNYLPENR